MTARPSPRLTVIILGFAWGATGLVVTVSILGLIGWLVSIEGLKTFLHPAGVAISPMTALAFILLGGSLLLELRKPPGGARKYLVLFCTAVVALIGAVKLLAYHVPIPLDEFFYRGRAMAPNTAGGLIAAAMALMLLDFRAANGHRPTVPLALFGASIGLMALTGYMFGAVSFYQVRDYVPMALNTAVALFLVNLAILAARPEYEPLATILSDSTGGVVARRLLPAAAAIPFILGTLCVMGLKLYDGPMGFTIYSLVITVVFITLAWWNARTLFRLDGDRHRAEQAAAEEHHLLRLLIDKLPDLVFVKDLESRFLVNNLAHAKRFGAASPEEMHGKHDRDYFEPALAEEYFSDEKKVMETGIPLVDKEQYFIDRAGMPRWVNVTKVPLHNTEGKIIGTVGIAHDITFRKQAQEERDQFFTLSADMMCIAGFDGYFKRVNPAFETILGYTPDELLSRPWLEFIHPDDQAATVNEGKKLTLGAVTLYFENRYRCKDGSYRWLSWTAVPVVREQRIYAVARDTTERRAVEEQMRETNRRLEQAVESERQAQQTLRSAQSTMLQTEKLAALGQMVAGVAHEINNPLSFVSNNVAVLQRDLRGVLHLLELYGQADPTLDEHSPKLIGEIRETSRQMDLPYTLANLNELLTRSRDGLRRIQQIVKDLRDFARLDESDLHEVNLNDGILSTITIIQGHAKKRGVRIETALGNLPPVLCYPAKINQVVMNLLSNAIDASIQGGVVTVQTRADGGKTQIEVRDTGSGIDPAVRERIFDPFFTTKPQGQGTGLGLSISYGIIRDHGGTIDVQSEMGKGSVFTVTLPLKGIGRKRDLGAPAAQAGMNIENRG